MLLKMVTYFSFFTPRERQLEGLVRAVAPPFIFETETYFQLQCVILLRLADIWILDFGFWIEFGPGKIVPRTWLAPALEKTTETTAVDL